MAVGAKYHKSTKNEAVRLAGVEDGGQTKGGGGGGDQGGQNMGKWAGASGLCKGLLAV